MGRPWFTDEQIRRLKNNSRVQAVCRCTYMLTEDALLELMDCWKQDHDRSWIESNIRKWGLEEDILGDEYIAAIYWVLRRGGMDEGNYHVLKKKVSDIALIASGMFVPKTWSIEWLPEAKSGIAEAYPERSIEDSLQRLGLSQEIVTANRVSNLRQFCKKHIAEEVIIKAKAVKAVEPEENKKDDEAEVEKYWQNPYVKMVVGRKTIMMKDTFFNEVCVLDEIPLNELLGIYEIDPLQLCYSSLSQIRVHLPGWKKTDERQLINTEQVMRIQIRRLQKLEEYASRNFDQIRRSVKMMEPGQKKIICRQLSEYPTSLQYPCGYSLREILDKVGISKTTYYKAINCKGYGMAAEMRAERDRRDLGVIMKVVEYKGFEKGIRQIYMMMPDLTGEQFAISKIRRLLRNAGIKTKVRGENLNRQRAREFHERNTKPNLLKREFRLHRPNEVRLTDVTYLDYGHKDDGERKRAYGSSCIDPVTGKLLAFNTSENNDVELAMETLSRLSDHSTMIGALFHSDQGILYLTDEFQEKVAEMGMVQSMSKRGNCWDNAPQESFFGHFKDECHYEECETFEQLQTMINEYAYYYNNERRQWSRCRMTPVEYEAYMEAMTDDEFAAYMEEEQTKYANMKKNAEKKAIERARTLGV